MRASAPLFRSRRIFEICVAEEEAFAGQVIELEQIIFAVGIHGVERIDETGYPEPLADHYVADIQIAVDKAGIIDGLGEDILKFVSRAAHGRDYFVGQLSVLRELFCSRIYLIHKRLIALEPRRELRVHCVTEFVAPTLVDAVESIGHFIGESQLRAFE